METEVKNYEIAYLISPNVSEEQIFGVAGKITSLIQDAKGAANKIEEPKKIKLAYSIKKQWSAYFGWTIFSMLPENLEEFKKKLRFEEKSVMRFLVVFTPKKVLELRKRPIYIKPKPEKPVTPTYRPPPREAEKQEQVDITALDKKLEEILGK
ncbi:MAG: 30S ribosomal protein S6 [Candidatus Sungbacteria bacterium RIFCSPLOWO2_12_FULL_41_11]|uniref:Small ribosomal subunit protein bS6 n=1 Tax=Candidatus Sungbacteria bacterium RIFCSPLOWO2_12_FULL_41_11 TaxID=1802286 RepID=A0A1G2LS62_9BACT|nr:MAG: 30S ribosomal protein S6 [Parcubacteria group bacterium GW2011_GWA2_42_14]OGZ98961.1 MAG: 30S ribosomal protein S6 [Candidatus Sungbacteria bacterium RIFCSPHIGHO2_02_FULL_41_12b]OHA14488.1 MAG: 30S ribosomal protein S6 [Candidatus Sungbacteria bacterium RIFCSPLOWO2_12_FULL_41_11]